MTQSPNIDRLREALRGELLEDAPLAGLSTYRVGGRARALAIPEDVEDLQALLILCRTEGWPLLTLGGGSNLLVSEAGFSGVVLRLKAPAFRTIDWDKDAKVITVGGGVHVTQLMGRAGEQGWAKVAFLEGIPGTLGGCVAMNAGTRDGEVADVLIDANVVSEEGGVMTISNAACGFAYRSSMLPGGCVVTSARLETGEAPPAVVKGHLQRHQDYRRTTQPAGRSGGSVFKNPEGDFAGRLIEQAGLKGTCLGGARISEQHGNWILTEEGASADDVYGLIRRCQEVVEARFSIVLETENILIGFDP